MRILVDLDASAVTLAAPSGGDLRFGIVAAAAWVWAWRAYVAAAAGAAAGGRVRYQTIWVGREERRRAGL